MSMFIEASEYVKRNGAILLRQALPKSDTESWESLWKSKYGSLREFPYYELYKVEPIFRVTIDTLKEILERHDENNELSIEEIIDEMNLEPDFSEYGA